MIAGVGVHLGVGGHLAAKLHAHEMLLLRGRDGGVSELSGADRGVKLVEEDLVLWRGWSYGDR